MGACFWFGFVLPEAVKKIAIKCWFCGCLHKDTKRPRLIGKTATAMYSIGRGQLQIGAGGWLVLPRKGKGNQ